MRRTTRLMMLTVLLVLMSLVFASTTSMSASKTQILKLAHISDENHPSHKGALLFKKLVEERTNEVKVQIYPNSTLGSAPEYTEQMALGVVEMGLSTSGQLQVWVPEYGAIMIPFLFESYEHAHRTLDGKAGELLAEKAAEKGFIVLANWEWGFRQITNNKRPINSPADVKGMKMRVPNEIQLQAMFDALGANSSIVAFPELYMALAQGVVDGQCNPIATIYHQKFYEVQDYLTLTNHIYNTQMLVISEIVWNSLSDGIKAILTDAAMQAGRLVRDLNQQEEDQLIADMEKKGMKIIRPDLAPFREMMGPAIDRIAEYAGKDFTAQFVKYVDEAR